MPSGVVHDRITLWLLPWIVGGTYILTRNAELTLLLSGSYLFSGMMFGPDLDIRSLQFKRWGFIRNIWLPYRQMMRHRSIFSHGLIVGTCVRLIYLGLIIAFIAIFAVAIAQLIFGFPWNWHSFVGGKLNLLITKYPSEAIAIFIGLEIGAMSHSISDWISSYRKLYLKKKQNKPKPAAIKRRRRQAKIFQKKK
ncbi:MAG: metal-binding protein [Cyanobacteria bacterium P01_G01_bin.39]